MFKFKHVIPVHWEKISYLNIPIEIIPPIPQLFPHKSNEKIPIENHVGI